MSISKSEFLEFIKNSNFRHIFNDLGWNNDKTKHIIVIDDKEYIIQSVAEKCGFKIFFCEIDFIPTSDIRKKLDNQIRKLFYHYILILKQYNENQHWIIPIKKTEKRDLVVINYLNHQVPELLYQKISDLKFTLEQEEKLTIVDVSKHVNDLFIINSEKITKQFYEGFKKQHSAFLSFIKGIDDEIKEKENKQKQWYASLMLNRLMFCYFIQKKDFLDGNKNYLKDKLKECRNKIGKGEFYNFYRSFLLKLFHNGLGNPENVKFKPLIGKIPYLNGGLFDVHELEKQYTEIDIDDKAFEKIFDFFDEYEWHLDTSFSGSGKEINPDVIGYIFEKYINDRSDMGAYYTKEDITDYISKNSIIPHLFEETTRSYPKAFKKESEIWQSLKESGDLYIYDAAKYGINPNNVWKDLPSDIKKGLNPNQKDLVEIRRCWNAFAPESAALPTETWREVIERRNRYLETVSKIKNGEIRSISDFITYNLNIKQFTQDIIDTTKDADLIRNFYKSLTKITILDPTCGSGAFLFAAMNILEPLYESCIEKMEELVSASKKRKYIEFEKIISEIRNPSHPNLQYYIYKSIILNNLYGVDIMKEAVEIAKLRLFLKLVASIEADKQKPNLGLEPLPDIDFNIKSGNTLVGFVALNDALASVDEQNKSTQIGFEFQDDRNIKKLIIDLSDDLAHIYKSFKKAQLNEELLSVKESKDKIINKSNKLNSLLNQYLYGAERVKNDNKYKDWLTSHQPFHWFAEFYEIIQEEGGFNCIIGNPPYVEYSKAKKDYQITGYKTEKCGNLFAFILEATTKLINKNGYGGMIIPISFTSTPRMKDIREIINLQSLIYCANFADRPGALFSGVHQKVSILIFNNSCKVFKNKYTTNFLHWYSKDSSNERLYLFDNIKYTSPLDSESFDAWLKIGNKLESSIWNKILLKKNCIYNYHSEINSNLIYLNMRLMFWAKCFINNKKSSEYKIYGFDNITNQHIVNSLFNSSLYFYFWESLSDCWHITKRELSIFKFDIDLLTNNQKVQLIQLSKKLENDLELNKKFVDTVQTDFEYYHKKSKVIIDEIDKVLAEHYGYSDEELDFIINYDIKYRMGKELEIDEDELKE